jgi:hypothetical protein
MIGSICKGNDVAREILKNSSLPDRDFRLLAHKAPRASVDLRCRGGGSKNVGVLLKANMDFDSVSTDKTSCGIKEMGESTTGVIRIKRLEDMHGRF